MEKLVSLLTLCYVQSAASSKPHLIQNCSLCDLYRTHNKIYELSLDQKVNLSVITSYTEFGSISRGSEGLKDTINCPEEAMKISHFNQTK